MASGFEPETSEVRTLDPDPFPGAYDHLTVTRASGIIRPRG